ncbi:L-fucose kinase-like isoform X2 [Gordionus sp. m RMFG-2023]
MGENCITNPYSPAFSYVPVSNNIDNAINGSHNKCLINLMNLIDTLLYKLTNNKALHGVWVCSTSMILNIPEPMTIIDDECQIITIPKPIEYVANSHGFYILDEKSYVKSVQYQKSINEINNTLPHNSKHNPNVPLVIGLIYFPVKFAQILLHLHSKPPIDCSTYMGKDRGAHSLKLTLFFDLLYPMYLDSDLDKFLSPNHDNHLKYSDDTTASSSYLYMARSLLWKYLHKYKVKAIYLREGKCDYIPRDCLRDYLRLFSSNRLESNISNSYCQNRYASHSYVDLDRDINGMNDDLMPIKMLNCLIKTEKSIYDTFRNSSKSLTIGAGTILHNCKIMITKDSNVSIGADCYLFGVDTNMNTNNHYKEHPKNFFILPDKIAILTLDILLPIKSDCNMPVMIVLGVTDNIKDSYDIGTFLNQPFMAVMKAKGIIDSDLWPSEMRDKSVYNARLYPILSLDSEKRGNLDNVTQFQFLDWILSKEKSASYDLSDWKLAWRLSIKEILTLISYENNFTKVNLLYQEISENIVRQCLIDPFNSESLHLNHLFKESCSHGYRIRMLQCLDEVSQDLCQNMTSLSPVDFKDSGQNFKNLNVQISLIGRLSRSLSNTADFLNIWAGLQGGLRSGPAANLAWRHSNLCFSNHQFYQGVKALQKERARWIDRPFHLVRAARHYAASSQCLIGLQVASAEYNILIEPDDSNHLFVPLYKIVRVEAPARLDLAGGWSDTPPICYENLILLDPSMKEIGDDIFSQIGNQFISGIVLNMAINIDGHKPIGVLGRRVNEPSIKIIMSNLRPEPSYEANFFDRDYVLELKAENFKEIKFDRQEDFEDIQPQSLGAIFKAALVATNIVVNKPSHNNADTKNSIDSKHILSHALIAKFGGGFEFYSWSTVSEGSGLGTSTILASCIIALLWTLIGRSFDKQTLLYQVLMLEQILTTGGGWQDQMGGIYGGIKLGLSLPKFPFMVHVKFLQLEYGFIKQLNEKLLLLYTGKSRLAKNILQEVIRNWYAKDNQILKNVKDICANAMNCYRALVYGDFHSFGLCLNIYRSQKSAMAPMSSEPRSFKRILDYVASQTLGSCFSGAGGGGFCYAIAKDSYEKQIMIDNLNSLNNLELDKAPQLEKENLDSLRKLCISKSKHLNGDGVKDENFYNEDVEDKILVYKVSINTDGLTITVI